MRERSEQGRPRGECERQLGERGLSAWNADESGFGMCKGFLCDAVQAEVDVIGYPTGGDNISITHGVVSRIELQNYTHTGTNNLIAVQVLPR